MDRRPEARIISKTEREGERKKIDHLGMFLNIGLEHLDPEAGRQNNLQSVEAESYSLKIEKLAANSVYLRHPGVYIVHLISDVDPL